MSAVYLIYYPISQEVKKQLQDFNYWGILVMVYSLMFAFIGSEYRQRLEADFYALFGTFVFLSISLILSLYENPFPWNWSMWISLTFVFLILMIDLCGYANRRQISVFYIPLIIEVTFFIAGITMLYFRVPERWFKKNKVVNMYLNSSIIYTIFLLNFLFEVVSILYYTLKCNSNNLKDDYMWWVTKNIYNN